MGFVKLDSGLLTSTLWAHREEREIFITALLMAEPYEVMQPTPQIEVDSLQETGFMVQPGWYGFVSAAGAGIIRQAIVDPTPGMEALRALGAPDPESRSKDFEGRRMVRVDGGYIVLNYIKYRDRDYTAAARAKRYRDRQKDGPSRRDAVTSHRNVTQAEEEADKEVHPTGVSPSPGAMAPPAPKSDRLEAGRREILVVWKTVAVPAGLPDVLLGTVLKLKGTMSTRLKDAAWLGYFQEAVAYAATHPAGAWMRGEGDRPWKVTLEWLLKPGKAEDIASRARAAGSRASPGSRRMAADTSTANQVKQLPVRKLQSAAGAP